MNMGVLQGIVCANITPFFENREVDYASVKKLARYLAGCGVNAIYPLGTNGEGLSLTVEERKKIAEVMVDEIAGKIPVAIQCGTQTLEDTLALVIHAKEIGADAAGVVTPFFFRFSDQGLEEYYSALLEAAGEFPIYVYNIPTNTNNDITADVVKKLCVKYDNLMGVKYSYPDLIRLKEYNNTKEGGLDVLIGCDKLIYPACKVGAVGTVSGPAAVFPELFSSLWTATVNGDEKKAQKVQNIIFENSYILAPYQEIPMIKQYLKSIGVIETDTVRIPFTSITQEDKAQIANIINRIKSESVVI
ncbi:MAG: dihydrodipicolinate synthase family protein [Anaerolineaceae bacterium]|nr:MAG: dihydrodipicolinate synthase family protein [Anaerolineaceae bacterium]